MAFVPPSVASRVQQGEKEVPHLTTSDGFDLYYSDWGDPRGQPVVLVHAWGLSGQMWSQQLPALTEAGLCCVVYDRRGHGLYANAADRYNQALLEFALDCRSEHHDKRGTPESP